MPKHGVFAWFFLPLLQERQLAAVVQLSRELNQLVEGIRQDMAAPLPEEDVALKVCVLMPAPDSHQLY